MVGVVLATHGGLGDALVDAMEMIVGRQPQVAALSLQVADRLEDATARLHAALGGVDAGEGVLVLTDMLGGTPSNLCLSLLGGTRPVEVVSGASLPMLLKAVQARRDAGLAEVAALVKKAGRAAVIVAGEALAGPEPRGEGGGAGVIALARVDDRLVHGQVTAGWVPHLRATVVVVANDRIAADPLLAGIVKTATGEVPVEVLSVAEAARRGAAGAWERDAALILFESLQDAARALDAGLPVTRINLGGLRHDAGRLCLCDGVTLDVEDCDVVRQLCRRGVILDVRLMPTERSRPLPRELEGCGS